ncbi:unnamed protein product, partial [Closterium sp. NIES-53]
WYTARQRGGGFGPCTYVLHTGDRAGEQCGGAHPTQRCFGRLTDAWRRQFPEATEIPRWGELSRVGVAIYDLDFDAILSAMYAVSISDEGDCYRCFPPDPGIGEAAALGACVATAPGAGASASSGTGEFALSGTASASASLTFTLDSGASRSFFRDRTILTPLSQPVAVSLADPSGGPVLSHFSTVLPCPAAPSGTLSGLYLPSFSTNLVSGADLQDGGVHQFTPACQRVTHCTEASTGRHLATFTRQPGSSLYTLTTPSPPVAEFGRVAASGQGHERYFLLVVDDYSRYTAVFPLRSKGDVTAVLIDWIRAARLPHFLWPFAVRYAAHQINLHPRVSRPETSPALLWTGKVGDASAFWVWGSRAFVRDLSADKLSPRAAPCDVTFDESVPYYRLFPYRTPSLPPPPLFLVPGPPPVDPLPPQGPAPSGVSQIDAVEPVEVTGDSGAARGAEPGGAVLGGAMLGGAEPGGAEPGGAEPGGAGPGGTLPGGATPGCVAHGGAELRGAPPGGSPGASSLCEPLSPQELREWCAQRWRCAAGAGGSSAIEGAAVAGPGGARTVSTGAAGPAGSTGAGAAEGVGTETTAGGPAGGTPGAAGGSRAAGGAAGEGAPAGGTGAVPAVSGVAARPRPYFVPLLEQPTSPLPAPSPYTGPTGGLAERREPASRPASPVRAARTSGRSSRQRPPPVPGTHRMSQRPSTAPLRVPLPSPPESSLPALADPESDSLRAASPTVTRLLATVVTDPSFESTDASALVTELSGMWIFRSFSPTPKMTTLRVLLHVAAHRDYELHSLDFSTAFLQGSLHEEIWLRRPLGFTGSFPPGTQWSLRRPVYGLRLAPREWHDTLRTTLAALGFAPSTADPSLFLRTDNSLPPFYILVYVDDLVFATADTSGLAHVKSELQKRHTCTDLGELRSYLGLQITRDRARRTITLTQSHMVQQVLQRFGFTYSSPQTTPLPTGHSLSALPSDESVESSGPYPELVGCLMYLMTCTRPDLAYPLSIIARYAAPGRHRPEHMAAAKRVLRYLCSTSGMGLVLGGRSPVVLTGHAHASWADDQATQRSSQGYSVSLGSGSVSWRATRSSSVLGSSCEAEIYVGAMAAQELRWLTYLLTDLGEQPRSAPVLYVDNKAMLALCREQRLEHRTKHIALRYFLARELQQHGQLRLAYVASEANTADVFTKALAPCDHQRFCTQLACFVLPYLTGLVTPSSPPLRLWGSTHHEGPHRDGTAAPGSLPGPQPCEEVQAMSGGPAHRQQTGERDQQAAEAGTAPSPLLLPRSQISVPPLEEPTVAASDDHEWQQMRQRREEPGQPPEEPEQPPDVVEPQSQEVQPEEEPLEAEQGAALPSPHVSPPRQHAALPSPNVSPPTTCCTSAREIR